MIFVQPASGNQKLLINGRVAGLAMGREDNLAGEGARPYLKLATAIF